MLHAGDRATAFWSWCHPSPRALVSSLLFPQQLSSLLRPCPFYLAEKMEPAAVFPSGVLFLSLQALESTSRSEDRGPFISNPTFGFPLSTGPFPLVINIDKGLSLKSKPPKAAWPPGLGALSLSHPSVWLASSLLICLCSPLTRLTADPGDSPRPSPSGCLPGLVGLDFTATPHRWSRLSLKRSAPRISEAPHASGSPSVYFN